MYDKQVVRRRRAVLAVLVGLSIVLLTGYFGEGSGGFFHSIQSGAQTVLSPIEDGASRAFKPVRDLVSGLPKTVVLTSEEVRMALEEPLQQIVDAVKETLDRTPPELAADIMDRGIMLAGGGSLLQGLDERLRDETQMPAHLAESPLTCVAVGSGRSLEEFEAIHRSNRNSRQRRR